jgi:hypothetical protein
MALIAPGDDVAEVRREPSAPAFGAEEMAEQGDAHLPQRPVVKIVPAADPVACTFATSRAVRLGSELTVASKKPD